MITKYLAPVAVCLCTASLSFAATVNFSSAVIDPSNTGSFLDNSGAFMEAVKLGTARTGPYTYNAPTASSNPNPNVTLNGITFTSSAGSVNPSGSFYSLASVTGGATLGYDTGRFSNVSSVNQSLYGLVYDVLRTGGNNQRLTLNLKNLTIGASYELQLVLSELNTADNPASNMSDRNVMVSAGAFTQSTDEQHGAGADGNIGFLGYGPTTGARLVTATFTADSSTELFSLLSGSTGGNSRVALAGFVISQVPEPSTYAMMLLGAVGLAKLGRRSKQG